MIPSQTQIQEAYEKAPKGLQDIILSQEIAETFASLRSRYKIHLDQAEKLALAINSVILGLSEIDHFPSLLREALPDSNDETRTEILKEINDEVFSSLRNQAQNKPSLDTAKHQLEQIGEGNVVQEAAPNKLSESTKAPVDEVEVVEDEEEEKPQNPNYRGTDPYREPIE